jgi:lysyl-tRNA synthetase class 1
MEIQTELPAEARGLGEPMKRFLLRLSGLFVGEVPAADEIHNGIYTLAREEMGVDPKEAFEAIYLVFLGLRRGPRAGWFLHSLEPEFVAERLRQAGGGE